MSLNNPLNSNGNRPSRVSDPERRPEPRMADNGPAQPWYVAPEENQSKKKRFTSKNIVKRVVSIVFPFAALAVITGTVAWFIIYAVGMYK